MSAVTQEKPKEESKPVELTPEERHQRWLDALEPEDICTVLRRNWGTPGVPSDKVDYFDGITFVGGVGRNIPWSLVKKWTKMRLVDKAHVFENNATQDDFTKATGRSPLEPGSLAAALQKVTPEKLAAILGDAQALELVKQVQRLVTSRQHTIEE